jgi:alpha-tubulin suppressor-like RCC1 family protein
VDLRGVRQVAVALAATAFLFGCKENGTGPVAPCGIASPCSTTRLKTLTLTPTYDTLLVGDTAQVVTAATDSAGSTVTNVHFTYASSNTAVMTVDTTGGVHAIGAGAATLKVSGGGLSASAFLTILAPIVQQTQAGGDFSCFLLPLGRGYCWGLDSKGQLGSLVTTACFDSATSTNEPCALTPTLMSGGLRLATVTTGGIVACGLVSGGAAYCWGDNTYGELGNNTVSSGSAQVPVSGGLAFASITAGATHVCGIASGGGTYCWGNDSTGQLGDTAIVYSTTPIPVVGAGPFTSVSAGGDHTCALVAGGAAYCWGDNTFGELGNGVAGNTSQPVAVAGGLTFIAISSGATHTCGIVTGGTAYCWGTINGATVPTAVVGGPTFTQITSGGGFSCGLSGGAAYCWGTNSDGQLGNGSLAVTSSATPVLVTGGYTFTSVSAGSRHACGTRANGTAACWGSNVFGPLGNSQQASENATPVIVGTPLG